MPAQYAGCITPVYPPFRYASSAAITTAVSVVDSSTARAFSRALKSSGIRYAAAGVFG